MVGPRQLAMRARSARPRRSVPEFGLLVCAMARYTLFAYADGADFEAVADSLQARFRQFISSRRWIAGPPTIVNRRYGATRITQSGVVELWDLGLTLELPEIGTELPTWFADIEAIARFLGTLHGEFGRSFSLGFVDTESDRTEELFGVSTNPSDTGKLPVLDGVRYIS